MKLLLIGEFSGLHNNLKEGLIHHGHSVILWAGGDGFKNFLSDVQILKENKNKITNLTYLLKEIHKIKGFDIIQLMSPNVFPFRFGISRYCIKVLKKNNGKIFLCGSGALNANTILANYFKKEYKYPQLFESYAENSTVWALSKKGVKYNKWLFGIINGYIPIMYEYAKAFREIEHSKLLETIPLPININNISYKDNIIKNGKVIVFHGITREKIKGTPVIKKAMERLKKDYPNEVDIIITGKMPINQYLEFLETVNIVIDQAYALSYGMNTLYAMAKGRIVVGGAHKECLKEFGLQEIPIVSFEPTVEDIYDKLVDVLNRKDEILEWGKQSRKFVEDNHDSAKIASKYLEVWENA